MKQGASITALSAARFYTPLIVLFAFSLLAAQAPGEGVGFSAGMAGALALLTHVLVFGAGAARRAFPPALARLVLSLGLIAVSAGVGAPRFLYAPQLLEGGLFAVTIAAAFLIIAVIVGRVPTLRDEAS